MSKSDAQASRWRQRTSTRPAERSKSRRERVSKQQWLATALATFAAEGEGAVSVERLARDLGVAKSGFYWHFRDRAELLADVLAYWEEAYTETVIDFVEGAAHEDPWDKLRQVGRLVIDGDLARYDDSMLTWGRRDPRVRCRVTSHLRRRFEYARRVLSECGLVDERLDLHASVFVTYLAWHDRINPSQSKKARRARVAALVDLIERDSRSAAVQPSRLRRKRR